jgi:hypothetical protein
VNRPAEQVRRELTAAEKKVAATSERRRALPAGSSRARVTTANAKWSTACQARDRLLLELEALLMV